MSGYLIKLLGEFAYFRSSPPFKIHSHKRGAAGVRS
jgi:hypothetical protein